MQTLHRTAQSHVAEALPFPTTARTSAERAGGDSHEETEEQDPSDEPATGPRTTAVVRRVGPPAAYTSSVEFPEHPGLGGTLRYLGNFPEGLYEVTDHLRRAAPKPVVGGLEAVTALAEHYGLPLPVQVIPRGARGQVPAMSDRA
ncbi:hypothetical protein ACGF12_30350 [Kitasatospora sp. NPDC048296]|uniref:hypothetical protein n=1 Tax=Kitasatospora sp. NPDC048296 TaxID=3364048 RepID=UPI00371E011E